MKIAEIPKHGRYKWRTLAGVVSMDLINTLGLRKRGYDFKHLEVMSMIVDEVQEFNESL